MDSAELHSKLLTFVRSQEIHKEIEAFFKAKNAPGPFKHQLSDHVNVGTEYSIATYFYGSPDLLYWTMFISSRRRGTNTWSSWSRRAAVQLIPSYHGASVHIRSLRDHLRLASGIATEHILNSFIKSLQMRGNTVKATLDVKALQTSAVNRAFAEDAMTYFLETYIRHLPWKSLSRHLEAFFSNPQGWRALHPFQCSQTIRGDDLYPTGFETRLVSEDGNKVWSLKIWKGDSSMIEFARIDIDATLFQGGAITPKALIKALQFSVDRKKRVLIKETILSSDRPTGIGIFGRRYRHLQQRIRVVLPGVGGEELWTAEGPMLPDYHDNYKLCGASPLSR